MKKTAKIILGCVVLFLLFPFIIIGFLCWVVLLFWDWLKEPARKKEYKQSYYYKDFQSPYHKGILLEDSFQFYNKARNDNLLINMIHPSDDSPDYLMIQDSIYLFPMHRDVFGGIAYNTIERKWEVDFDGDYFPLDDEWEKYKKLVDTQGLPCYLLIKQSEVHSYDDEVPCANLPLDMLPPYVRVVREYIDIIAD